MTEYFAISRTRSVDKVTDYFMDDWNWTMDPQQAARFEQYMDGVNIIAELPKITAYQIQKFFEP